MEIFPKGSITKQGAQSRQHAYKGHVLDSKNECMSLFLYNNKLFLNFYNKVLILSRMMASTPDILQLIQEMADIA